MCKNKKDQMFCKEMNKIHKKLNMKRLQQLTCKIDHIYLQLISYTKAIEYHCISQEQCTCTCICKNQIRSKL